MCLAVPGRVEALVNDSPLERSAQVSFGGIRKVINLSFVPDVVVGDYVIVHVGFAISRLDELEAQQIFRYLEEIDAQRGGAEE